METHLNRNCAQRKDHNCSAQDSGLAFEKFVQRHWGVAMLLFCIFKTFKGTHGAAMRKVREETQPEFEAGRGPGHETKRARIS